MKVNSEKKHIVIQNPSIAHSGWISGTEAEIGLHFCRLFMQLWRHDLGADQLPLRKRLLRWNSWPCRSCPIRPPEGLQTGHYSKSFRRLPSAGRWQRRRDREEKDADKLLKTQRSLGRPPFSFESWGTSARLPPGTQLVWRKCHGPRAVEHALVSEKEKYLDFENSYSGT